MQLEGRAAVPGSRRLASNDAEQRAHQLNARIAQAAQ